MTRKMWVLVIASVLVSSLLLEGQVFAVGEKKIVMVSNSIDFVLLKGVLLNQLNGINVVHTLSFVNALAVEIPLNKTVTDLVNLVSGISSAVVHNDLVFSVLPITPAASWEVPLPEAYDWGLQHISVDMAHQTWPAVTGSGVKVAIVDTGIDCMHPDLPIADGFNALPGGVSFCDDHGHGTHITGIIAARVNNNGLAGIIGAAPEASLVAVKVLDIHGKGYLSDLINGLQWIWSYNNGHQNQKIRLVNMSLGFSANSPPLEAAIEKLSDDHGTFMVAAAGNRCLVPGGQEEDGGDEGQGACNTSQTNTILYPANYPVVIAVTATNFQDQITDYSLEGQQVDVTAPGGALKDTKRILSTFLGGWYGWASGTSQAAAHVTGALALKLQQQSNLSLQDVPRLLQTATPVPGNPPPKQQGAGLINAETLLAAP